MHRLLLLLVLLPALPARAQAVPFGRPTYDLVAVATSAFFAEANAGGANEGVCTVLNVSTSPLRVRLDADVVYADGRAERLSRIQDPGVLEVGGGFELSVFFLIPADAPLGPAQFSCAVRAQSLLSRAQQEGEISIAPFTVTAP
ncbi:MAG TPA: hypothetical protein VFV75_06655 [Candidatus Polarisedimenticolaceae bacterium]|nr:hypothetical protein [Candidatus Polarisedimenticolaceae bacterium]